MNLQEAAQLKNKKKKQSQILAAEIKLSLLLAPYQSNSKNSASYTSHNATW